jgi:TIR domain
MTDVFISYASEDRQRARTVANALQARGWSVWWDRDVKAGQAFDQAIEHQLEIAKSVVVLWSKDSIASEWVKGEAAAAVQRRVLVPALIDNVKLPLEFSRRQTADLIGWAGDTSHAGFQALCDGIRGTAGMTARSTSDASENLQAPRDSWNQRWVLKGWWQTLPGVLMASAICLAALAVLIAALNQARTPKTVLPPTPQPGQSAQPSGGLGPQAGQPANAAPAVVASTDRDKPTQLISNEIRGLGVGEDISYYYAFNAGPGTVTVIVDGKNKRVSYGANAIGIELSNLDAERLLSIRLGNTSKDDRKVGHVQFGRQQRIIMRVLLDKRTIDYKVRLEGAVDFSPAQTPK